MPLIEVTAAQVEEARAFLVNFLESQPEFATADFAPGSVHHDRVIRPLAYIVAFLRAETQRVADVQDVRNVLSIADEAERNELLDAVAANLFASRNSARYARGSAELLFTQRVDVLLPAGTLFYAPGGKTYVLDSTDAVLLPAAQLRQVTETALGATQWATSVAIRATQPGAAFDSEPGRFTGVSPAPLFLASARYDSPLAGGQDAESAEAFVARVPELLTQRTLTTPRSIRTQLQEEQTALTRRFVAGFGDPEMQRDRPEWLDGDLRVHVGGSIDVYLHTQAVARRRRIPVGGTFTVPGPLVTFSDIDFRRRGIDFRALVGVGDILRLHEPRSQEAALYLIRAVDRDHVRVSEILSFREIRPTQLHAQRRYSGVAFDGTGQFTLSIDATRFTSADVGRALHVIAPDLTLIVEVVAVSGFNTAGYGRFVSVTFTGSEAGDLPLTDLQLELWDGDLLWSAGTNVPDYDDCVAPRYSGAVTSTAAVAGAAALPPGAVYRVRSVGLETPDHPEADAFTGLLEVTSRGNQLPGVGDAQDTFVVESLNPRLCGSTSDVQLVRVGYADSRAGSGATLTADGVDPELATLTTPQDAFSAGDVGRHLLLLRPENLANAAAYTITAYNNARSIEITRMEAAVPVSTSVVTETSVKWRMEPTFEHAGVVAQVDWDTFAELGSLQARLSSPDDRVACASSLARAFYPVWLSISLRYSLASTATTGLDESAAARALVAYVSTFPEGDTLNLDDITSWLRGRYPQIGNIYRSAPAPTMNYTLAIPDGRLVNFQSADALRLDQESCVSEVDEALWLLAENQGVSTRNTIVFTAADLIEFTEVV